MVIIDLSSGLDGITVDNNSITVDSTEITVDNNNSGVGYTIKFIPRYFTENVKLVFRNELTDIVDIVFTNMTQINGLSYCVFSFDIEEATSFELSVYDFENNNLLFRGKAFATSQIDLENYKMTKPNNNNKIIM